MKKIIERLKVNWLLIIISIGLLLVMLPNALVGTALLAYILQNMWLGILISATVNTVIVIVPILISER